MNTLGQVQRLVERYRDSFIVVEGKADVLALERLGLSRVYEIYQDMVSVRLRVQQLLASMKGDEPVIILTDFDRRGKQLFVLLCHLFADYGKRIDPLFRGVVKQTGILYIEDLGSVK